MRFRWQLPPDCAAQSPDVICRQVWQEYGPEEDAVGGFGDDTEVPGTEEAPGFDEDAAGDDEAAGLDDAELDATTTRIGELEDPATGVDEATPAFDDEAAAGDEDAVGTEETVVGTEEAVGGTTGTEETF
jgi:hypothetical protein